MSSELSEPTAEQCDQNSVLLRDGNRMAYATWYPRIGGVAAKAIVQFLRTSLEADDECFDVLLWNDKHSPFNVDDSGLIVLHHCSAAEFVNFGNKVIAMAKSVER